MKFIIKATIPTTQYGNLQPEYEVEAETYEEAQQIAMPYIEKLWNEYCQVGSELKKKSSKTMDVKVVELTSSLTGGSAFFDEHNHVYTNAKGERLLGGSSFAKKYVKPFNKEAILEAMEKKYDIPRAQIQDMWKMKSEASNGFGTAIHKALELYGVHQEIGKITGANKKPVVNSSLHDQPILKTIVEDFFKGREKETARYEAFVIDEDRLLCGLIDRLLIVDVETKVCRVQDFKTNADINKVGQPKYLLAPFESVLNNTLNCYWLQLSFYANILEAKGWTVEGLDIFHHDGKKWNTYSEKVMDLSKVI